MSARTVDTGKGCAQAAPIPSVPPLSELVRIAREAITARAAAEVRYAGGAARGLSDRENASFVPWCDACDRERAAILAAVEAEPQAVSELVDQMTLVGTAGPGLVDILADMQDTAPAEIAERWAAAACRLAASVGPGEAQS